MELMIRETANLMDLLWMLGVAQDETSEIVSNIQDDILNWQDCPCCVDNYDYEDDLVE